jgi:lipoprotein-anchoring transpeptidase ErfK/SrfK
VDGNGRELNPALRVLAAIAAIALGPAVAVALFVLTREGDSRIDPVMPAERVVTSRVVPGSTEVGDREIARDDPAPVATPSAQRSHDGERNLARRATRKRETPVETPVVRVRPGEQVEVKSRPGGSGVGSLRDETEFGSPTVLSVRRQRPGWLGVSTELVPDGDLGWIKTERTALRGGYVDSLITVDLSQRRARLFRSGEPRRSWPVSIGAPGTETPTGHFAVTDTFKGDLNPAYGCCALALTATQPNLPKGWVGGNRIAFHGSDEPPGGAVSTGCLRSPDSVLRDLIATVPLGTPVVISK